MKSLNVIIICLTLMFCVFGVIYSQHSGYLQSSPSLRYEFKESSNENIFFHVFDKETGQLNFLVNVDGCPKHVRWNPSTNTGIETVWKKDCDAEKDKKK